MDPDVMNGTVGLAEVLLTAGFIAVLTLLSVVVYRAMERPRLLLTQTPTGPRARPSDIIKYVLSIPILLTLWVSFFGIVVFVAPVQSSARTQLLMPIAIVIAIRLLAHLSLTSAYHLSSVLPMVILASLILGEGLPDEAELERLYRESQDLDMTTPALLSVYCLEFAFAFIWYWAQRWQYSRRSSGRDVDPTPNAEAQLLGAAASNENTRIAAQGKARPSRTDSRRGEAAADQPLDPSQQQRRTDAARQSPEAVAGTRADQSGPDEPDHPKRSTGGNMMASDGADATPDATGNTRADEPS